MKIGMLTGLWYIAESATVIESLRHIAALGFRYVDIHGVFHASPAHLNSDQCREVKTEMAALGLEPRNYVLHSPCNLASANEAELEQAYAYLVQGIQVATAWGIHQLMLNAGQWAFGVSRETAWTRAVHFLQRVCEYAAPRGVLIVIEAEPYVWYLVNDIDSTVRMRADVNRQNFAVLVDLGHMGLARESPGDLERLKDSIVHAHFSDHESFRHTNQIIGTGVTRTGEYLAKLHGLDVDRQLQRLGYDELVVSFELGVPGDKIENPDEWVRRSLRYVQQVAPYMRLA
jgi:sugar phosphate isomerase/epimerase